MLGRDLNKKLSYRRENCALAVHFVVARLVSGATENAEWKMRYEQKCKGGKCRSRLAVWKAGSRLYRETALSYFLKIVLRLMTE